jgi:hypothetical protein
MQTVDEPSEGLRAALPQKPAGGKALVRMLTHLEKRGFHALADAAVEKAVPEDAHASLEIFRLPNRPAAAPPTEGRARRGGARRAADAEAATAAAVAQEYADAALSAPPPSPPTASGPQWRSLGPWTVPNGQTYGSSRVNVSGRVAAIAVHPTNPARVLCGAAHGGVWESFNRGATWTPRTDYAATLTVGALAYDHRNPNTVYCGTGEGNWWSWLGAGILRSQDGGSTWATLCTAPFMGVGFYDLKVSPADSQRLVAATNNGLYVSHDGGVNWTRRRTSVTWAVDIAAGPVATAEMIAACADGVYRSADGGTTWTAVTISGAPARFDRLAVSLAPSNPSVAYAWGAVGAAAYLYRRAGNAWSAMPTPPGVSTGQAWYDWFLAAAPDTDATVYVGAIDSYRADLSGHVWSWTPLSNKGSSGDSIHPDQHAICFEPGRPGTVYIGCDGGLYRSDNRGVNFTHCNNGLVITEMEYLAQDFGTSRRLIGGTQDNGTEMWTGSSTWTHIADGDGGDCAINRTTPQTVFHTYYGMSPERSTTGGGFGSWAGITPPVPAGEGSPFYPPFECSASGGDTIAMAGAALYVSRNNGSNWTRLAYPAAGSASAMHVPTPNLVYVGTSDGRVLRSQWSGSAWGAVTALTTPRAGATVSDLKVDANNPQRIWATYSNTGGGRVFRSDDGGSHWTDCSAGGLPNLPIIAVEVDNWNSNRVWVAADLGVYQSLNGGANWTNYSASLPNCFIGDLIFHPHARVLRAGTRNRGVWEIPVDGWMTTPICGRQWVGQLAAHQTQRWFTFNWPATWHILWTVMPTTAFAGGAEVTWSVALERANSEFVTYWITVTNLSNVPISFEGRYAILSRY